MQDNYKNTDPLSPAFENMAWEQMSAKLDQEKPVLVPFWKRGLPLLLVFGLLLSGLFAYSTLATEAKSGSITSSALLVNPSSENEESAPILNQEKNIPTTITETISSSTEIKKEKELVSMPSKKQRLEETNTNRGQSILKSNNATQNNQNSFLINPVPQRKLPKLPRKTLSPSKQEKPAVSNEKEEPIASKEISPVSAFDPVVSLVLNQVENEGNQLRFTEDSQSKSKNRFVFGGSLGIGYDYSLKMYTASIGLDVWKPFSSRFGLKSGLHFSHARSINEVFSWSSQNEIVFFNSNNDPDLASTSGESSKQYTLNKFNSLIIPIEAYYRISPKVSLRAGFETATRLSSSIFNNDGSRTLDSELDQNASDNMAFEASSSDLIFKRMDLRGKIGIDFFPTDHIVLGLNYHHGLSPFTQEVANGFSLRSKIISLNAGFRF